jgi:hypothetical protein
VNEPVSKLSRPAIGGKVLLAFGLIGINISTLVLIVAALGMCAWVCIDRHEMRMQPVVTMPGKVNLTLRRGGSRFFHVQYLAPEDEVGRRQFDGLSCRMFKTKGGEEILLKKDEGPFDSSFFDPHRGQYLYRFEYFIPAYSNPQIKNVILECPEEAWKGPPANFRIMSADVSAFIFPIFIVFYLVFPALAGMLLGIGFVIGAMLYSRHTKKSGTGGIPSRGP